MSRTKLTLSYEEWMLALNRLMKVSFPENELEKAYWSETGYIGKCCGKDCYVITHADRRERLGIPSRLSTGGLLKRKLK